MADTGHGLALLAGVGEATSVGVYVIATIVSVIVAYRNRASFSGVTREKRLIASEAGEGTSAMGDTSFSRVAGMVGIAYLTAFLWGLGLFVLMQVWSDPGDVGAVISSSGQYLMAGSALFAPYAFNQLAQIFSKPPAASGGSTTSQQPAPAQISQLSAQDIMARLQPR